MQFVKKMLLKCAGFLCRSKASKIIFYHDISDKTVHTDMATSLIAFQEHVETAEQLGFQIVTEIKNPKKEIQICFDDGFRGLWDCRDYILKQNWRPTVFIAVELIGKPGYLTKDEIAALDAEGVIFQSHCWSHKVLTDFNSAELEHEVKDSKIYLEDMLGHEVNEICFPVGYFSDEVLNSCRNAGYTKMYSSVPGNYFDQLFPGVVRRNLVQFYSADELTSVVYGGLTPFASRYVKMHYLKEQSHAK